MDLINREKLLNKIDAYCKTNCKYTEAEQDVMCRACMVDDIMDMVETIESEDKEMGEISETEIKSMTKEQNYMRGYKDGKSDVLDRISAEIEEIETYDGLYIDRAYVFQIIDKYIAKSEE